MNNKTKAKIAEIFKLLADHELELDLTSNGVFTRCYVEHDWSGAYEHSTSTNKACIVAKDATQKSVKIFCDSSGDLDAPIFEFFSSDKSLTKIFENFQNEVFPLAI